jgi:hypothetical protein
MFLRNSIQLLGEYAPFLSYNDGVKIKVLQLQLMWNNQYVNWADKRWTRELMIPKNLEDKINKIYDPYLWSEWDNVQINVSRDRLYLFFTDADFFKESHWTSEQGIKKNQCKSQI